MRSVTKQYFLTTAVDTHIFINSN